MYSIELPSSKLDALLEQKIISLTKRKREVENLVAAEVAKTRYFWGVFPIRYTLEERAKCITNSTARLSFLIWELEMSRRGIKNAETVTVQSATMHMLIEDESL
jgi:hypothetical protein